MNASRRIMPEDKSELANGSEMKSAATSSIAVMPMRTIVFAVASVILVIVCFAFALQYFVAERLPELTEENLQAAMVRWQKNGPVSYDLDVELRGAQPGRVQVAVRQREVESETRD